MLVWVKFEHLATEQYIDSILLKVYHLLPVSHQMKNKLLCSSAMRIPLKISNLSMNLDIIFSLKSSAFFYLGLNGDLFTSSFHSDQSYRLIFWRELEPSFACIFNLKYFINKIQ